ncbi:Hypothetical predicted protein [Olea europaea subsp. europaea]|uniref:DUF1985 domain-containing protein n=1 Tax=Olea europaea subsp. europaea TaxID=158383 RepID=A0A8S0QU99_OLEEU|nr:Hypothetical predicted protein [Olea europaea subsp. europaea]
MMEFEFRISESARLRAHISQHSNLKYVKIVTDHFDERYWEDFRNSSLGYLADVLDIQFSAQLIQQLVFRTIRTDKVYELWFSVQRRLMRFGLQEYMLVTGLRCGAFLEGAKFDRLLKRRRLKERRLLHGFRGTWAKKFQKAKRRKEKEITYIVHGFPIALQVWAYEALPEDRCRATVNASGDDDRDGGHTTRKDLEEEASVGGRSEEQTSGGDEEKGALGSDPEGEDSEDTSEPHDEGSNVGEDTRGGARGASSSPQPPRDPSLERRSTTQARAVGTSAPGLSRGDVEELLLDQRILFEMRLRIVKLEIQQHVTSVCTSLREFLGTLVARAGPTTAEPATRAKMEAGVSGSLPKDVYGGPTEPCPYESDIAIDIGNMQDVAHIAPRQDDPNLPVPAASEEMQEPRSPRMTSGMTMKRRTVAMRWMAMALSLKSQLPGRYPKHEPEFLQQHDARHDCDDQLLLRTLYKGGGQSEPRSSCS